jgi:hypothetical protein
MEPGEIAGTVRATHLMSSENQMRRLLVLLGVLAGATAIVVYRAMARPDTASVVPTAQEDATMQDGFEQILKQHDGRYSKHGWNHYGPGYFDLDQETGILTSHGGMGLLWYAVKQYGDFVLDLEFKCADNETNSGIFLRVPGVLSSDDYIYHSFEIQINEAGEGIHHTAAVYDAEAPSAKAANPPGEWNRYRITFQGSRITVELNSTKVIDWDAEPRGKVADFAARGYIGLQNHDDRSPVYFRNIYVKE